MGGPMASSKSLQNNYRLLARLSRTAGTCSSVYRPGENYCGSQSEFEQLLNSFDKEK